MSAVYVNVDCANIYAEGNYRSAIVTQAVLWEKLKVLTAGKQFSEVVCEDGYQGWISNHQINVAGFLYDLKMVTAVFKNIYEKDSEKAEVVRTAGAGCYLPSLTEKEKWCETILPDGRKGWIESSIFKINENDPADVITSLSRTFLGIPYFWGGKTSRGLDCSGFVQLLHKIAGIKIRRDSPMQFEDARAVGEDILSGNPGDLLFFSENGSRITHVALKLKNNEIIHARGMVKINSLEKDSLLYDTSLIKDFVAVKTFF